MTGMIAAFLPHPAGHQELAMGRRLSTRLPHPTSAPVHPPARLRAHPPVELM